MRAAPRLSRRSATAIVISLSVASAASVALLVAQPSSSAVHRPTTWAATGPLVTADLPVRLCPTRLGAPAPRHARLPSHVRADVTRPLAATLTTFSDALGTLDVVAPSTWQCTALEGVAGLSTLIAYPPGQARPAWGDVTGVHHGIVASQTGGCSGCSLETACSLFASARQRYIATYRVDCQHAEPHDELVVRSSRSKTRFIDPPGVAGAGRPSGGPDTAFGAMVWHQRRGARAPTAWLITCTLPPSDQQLCVLSVDAFLSRH